jgi:hypothetical protein
VDRARELFDRLCSGGIDALQNLIDTRTNEELFLDFKRSADNGKGKTLHDKDALHLSRAISGFGNSEGGVLVWGVDCSGSKGADVASSLVPLDDAQRFVGSLLSLVGGRTVPPHSTIEARAIIHPGGPSGFVVCLIPKSDFLPLQAIPSKDYCIRVGSSFEKTPHTVLEAQFGKAPQVKLSIISKRYGASFPPSGGVAVGFNFSLANTGVRIAREIFATLAVSIPLGPSTVQIDGKSLSVWNVFSKPKKGNRLSLISKPDFRLPPTERVDLASLHMTFAPPFNGDLEISWIFGADSCAPQTFLISKPGPELAARYEQISNPYLGFKDPRMGEKAAAVLFKPGMDDRKVD